MDEDEGALGPDDELGAAEELALDFLLPPRPFWEAGGRGGATRQRIFYRNSRHKYSKFKLSSDENSLFIRLKVNSHPVTPHPYALP